MFLINFLENALQILSYIFEYLPLEDRKNVRLVCQLWYSNCCKENMVFRAAMEDGDVKMIQEVLENCKLKHLDLSFQGVAVYKLPAETWCRIGNRVRSLDLYKCRLSECVMKYVISYCKNLKCLSIYYEMFASPCDTLFYHPTTWEKFVSDDIILKDLHTLEIYTQFIVESSSEIYESTFKSIFLIFPNIIHLGLGNFQGKKRNVFKISRAKSISAESKIDKIQLAQIFTNLALAIFSFKCNKDYKTTFNELLTLRLVF